MARTSKKNQTALGALAYRQPEKIYSAGIYARLSVDTDERKNESIETQVEIAKEFIGRQKDMIIYDIYVDLGKTGTNFEREGFEHMMRDVRMRKIDCIVVKDLSRFGRNHIETGNYIEKIFPFMGVRFIAVTDNFDSINISGQNETLSINLKNLVNEMYARDIAVKVKASKKLKWEQGSYTGSVPPYGYRAEWVGDRKCLFIENITSDIVKRMYALFLSGKNMKEIATWLYEEGIQRPGEYRRTGQIYCKDRGKLQEWPRRTVKSILTNPVYMGWLVQGRTCGKDYKMRDRHDIDSSDWSIKEHTHDSIISEDDFFKVVERFEKTSIYCNKTGAPNVVSLEEDIFQNVLYCGDCGSKMIRKTAAKELKKGVVRAYNYNCPMYSRIDHLKCRGKNITFYALTDIVKEAIKQEFSLSEMRPKDLVEIHNKEVEALKEEWNGQIFDYERKIEGLRKLGSEQYLKYRMGELDEAGFKNAKEENDKKTLCLQTERKAIAEKLRTIDSEAIKKNHFLRTLVKGSGKGELTAEVIQTLIDRIEVYPDHRVKIIFAYKRNDLLLGEEGI